VSWLNGFAKYFGYIPQHSVADTAAPPKSHVAPSPEREELALVTMIEDLQMELRRLRGQEPPPTYELPQNESFLGDPVPARWPLPQLLEGDPLLHEQLVPSHPQYSELSYLLTKPWSERRASCEERPTCPVHDESWSGTTGLQMACLRCLSHREEPPLQTCNPLADSQPSAQPGSQSLWARLRLGNKPWHP